MVTKDYQRGVYEWGGAEGVLEGGSQRARPRRRAIRPFTNEVLAASYLSVSSGSGAILGAVRRYFMSPSPVAFPARCLKKSAAVSTTPTFWATAAAIHWFKDTPSSFASRWAAFLMERGSFNG